MRGRIILFAAIIIAATVAVGSAVIFLGSKPKPTTPKPRPTAQMDQIDPILRNVPCAILVASLVGDTLQLVGYAFDRSKVDGLIDALRSLDGVREVRANVEPINDAQCDLVETLAPYVSANQDTARGIAVTSRNPDGRFMEGDALVLDVQGPDRQAYLYVDYYTSDGSVVHMMPNPAAPRNRVAAGTTLALGEGSSALGWIVGAPFGTEMIVAVASPKPIFRAPRKEVEDAATYVRSLRQSLDDLVRSDPGAPVVANILFVTTTSRR